ncbi:NLI interacting factor-like phosphatase-domain-containing protein [Halteromyces radiatus]|uniref:NLI interacting factor-like phosphatase-domain-containing protein n=1 Tax=Halteromyces radiatus TaxID=101107 RepID=UPI00221EF5F4|nr:NLI interacting factor-like phosphatase-domain-containing protein [Halteromyces radiatus]KAI8089972.1 NLI interacting factor-like phosphatase-domain-containing protein [Halteromyces radiatus]
MKRHGKKTVTTILGSDIMKKHSQQKAISTTTHTTTISDSPSTTIPMKPSKEYLKVANEPSILLRRPRRQKEKQLLILDLNGTLVSRTNRRTGMYVRPHMDTFLDYIFRQFIVMVWSSAQRVSVKRMSHLFGSRKTELRYLLDRRHFGLDWAQYNSDVETIKDLNKLWNHDKWLDLRKYSAYNTIIIDDSPAKSVLQPYNSIHISTFNHNSTEFLEKGDQELLTVMDYLKQLEQETNIANYIQHSPYSSSSSLSTMTPSSNRICDYYHFGSIKNGPIRHDFSQPDLENRNKFVVL